MAGFERGTRWGLPFWQEVVRSQRTLGGWSMRSEANLRVSECPPPATLALQPGERIDPIPPAEFTDVWLAWLRHDLYDDTV